MIVVVLNAYAKQIGGFTPHNVISGEHVLFLASFHNNDVTLSQFQVRGRQAEEENHGGRRQTVRHRGEIDVNFVRLFGSGTAHDALPRGYCWRSPFVCTYSSFVSSPWELQCF